jgi:hypothetical protein
VGQIENAVEMKISRGVSQKKPIGAKRTISPMYGEIP